MVFKTINQHDRYCHCKDNLFNQCPIVIKEAIRLYNKNKRRY